jgi:hypothetical protein
VGTAKRSAEPRPSAATADTSTAAVPEKPSNCDYDAAAAWEIAREVRTAAAQNARVKPAAFVLLAGGPCDEEGQPHMPQGKGKYAAPTPNQQQVRSHLTPSAVDVLRPNGGQLLPSGQPGSVDKQDLSRL